MSKIEFTNKRYTHLFKKKKRKDKQNIEWYFHLWDKILSYGKFLVVTGGYFSDTQAYVNKSCRLCDNGTFVHYNKAPGKSKLDCKACPKGKIPIA